MLKQTLTTWFFFDKAGYKNEFNSILHQSSFFHSLSSCVVVSNVIMSIIPYFAFSIQFCSDHICIWHRALLKIFIDRDRFFFLYIAHRLTKAFPFGYILNWDSIINVFFVASILKAMWKWLQGFLLFFLFICVSREFNKIM